MLVLHAGLMQTNNYCLAPWSRSGSSTKKQAHKSLAVHLAAPNEAVYCVYDDGDAAAIECSTRLPRHSVIKGGSSCLVLLAVVSKRLVNNTKHQNL